MHRLPLGKGVTPHFLPDREVVGIRHDGPISAERSLVGKTRILFPGGVDEVAPGVGRIAHHQDRDNGATISWPVEKAGHSRRFRDVRVISALPSNSDIARCSRHVSKVPQAYGKLLERSTIRNRAP
jgi:hypothetical protein